MIFLTGVDNVETQKYRADERFGLMATPDSNYSLSLVASWRVYAADNGCFAAGDRFDVDRWMGWLARMPRATCLFAALPDVVGDHAATLERSAPHVDPVRKLGYLPAFVAQNGCEPNTVPWGDISAVFIGGDDEFKESDTAAAVVGEGARRGKWTHVGRVNSRRRMRLIAPWGTKSCDGTVAKYDPPRIHRIAGWLNDINGSSA